MTEAEYLLIVLSEECAEVSERVCKALRFGKDEVQPGQGDNNMRRIQRELGDLIATAELLGIHALETDKAAKREKLKKFMAYSREIGIIKE